MVTYIQFENSLAELKKLEQEKQILLNQKNLVLLAQKGILKIGNKIKNNELYDFDPCFDYILSNKSDIKNGILNFEKVVK